MTDSTCCWPVWVFWIIVLYKLVDYLIRKPFISGRKDKHILVTGCDTGFGHELAKRLDKAGVTVWAGCLTERGEDELRKVCTASLRTVPLNVADPKSVRQAYEVVKAGLPPGTGLWGVMNNAGISGAIGPNQWLELEDYRQVFDVNLYGLIDVTVTFLPLVKKARGRVVNTASVFGRHALVGASPYTISKYGVEAFSDVSRRELIDFGVTIHLIEPGFHKTNIASRSNLEAGLDKSWNRLSADLKEEYGEKFYEDSKKAIIDEFIEKIASPRISDVVDAYEHALTGWWPRARYVVGKDAKFLWLPLQWMPEWLCDTILNKLNKNKPIPAVLKKK